MVLSSGDSDDSQAMAAQIEDSSDSPAPTSARNHTTGKSGAAAAHNHKRPLANIGGAPAQNKRRRVQVPEFGDGEGSGSDADTDSDMDAPAVVGMRLPAPSGTPFDVDDDTIELSDDDDADGDINSGNDKHKEGDIEGVGGKESHVSVQSSTTASVAAPASDPTVSVPSVTSGVAEEQPATSDPVHTTETAAAPASS